MLLAVCVVQLEFSVKQTSKHGLLKAYPGWNIEVTIALSFENG